MFHNDSKINETPDVENAKPYIKQLSEYRDYARIIGGDLQKEMLPRIEMILDEMAIAIKKAKKVEDLAGIPPPPPPPTPPSFTEVRAKTGYLPPIQKTQALPKPKASQDPKPFVLDSEALAKILGRRKAISGEE
jgi:hypothetical protein